MILDIQESQGVILGFVALIILIIVIWSIKKYGWKAAFVCIMIGLCAYLYISDAIL